MGRLDLESITYSFGREDSKGREVFLTNVLVGALLSAPDGRAVKGYGEAHLRGEFKPAAAKSTWRRNAVESLNTALEALSSAHIDLSTPRSAVLSVATLTPAPTTGTKGLLSTCVRAIETALLDAVAKFFDLSLSALLAGAAIQPVGVVLTAKLPTVSQIADPLAKISKAKSVRFSEHSLIAFASARRSETQSRTPVLFVQIGSGMGSVGLATATHIAAVLGASVWRRLQRRSVLLSLPVGPGHGAEPDWDQILSGLRVKYFSTAPLQSSHEVPVNRYDGEALHVLGPNGGPAFALTRAALARGADVRRYAKGSFVVSGLDGKRTPFIMSRTNLSDITASAACNQKEVTRSLLAAEGVPVARGRTFKNDDWQGGVQFAHEIGFPVVLKPAAGFRGIGVYAGIPDEARLLEAMAQLKETRLGHQDFIVEKHIPGEEYRVLVVGDQAVAAIRRVPASVTGDGTSSIAELILKKNRLRRSNPSLRYRPIKYGQDLLDVLNDQQLSLSSVPQAGMHIPLSTTSNLSQGGDSVDAYGSLHPSILATSVKAARAIPGLGFAGVDFQIEDPSLPVTEQTCAVLEMNAHASISGAVFPMYGEPRDVPAAMLNELCREGHLSLNDEVRDQIALHVVVRGRIARVGYGRWIAELAEQNGLVGWVKVTSGRTVEFVVQGQTSGVTVLSIAAVLGPKGSKPTSATAHQVTWSDLKGFRVLRGDSTTPVLRVLQERK